MNVIVPHTPEGLKPETRKAVLAHAPEFFPLVGESAYHDLIAALWSQQEGFVTVEQDVVPGPEDIQAIIDCPEPWCAYAYDYPPFGLYAGMGCAKFSAQLLKEWPQAMNFCALESDEAHPRKHFCRVDGWLKRYLQQRGVTQHVHGVVRHLHSGGPAHGCVKR